MPVTVSVNAPESITRERLFDWLRDLGIDPDGISRVLIERGGISIDLNARGIHGQQFAVGSTEDDIRIAQHTIVIPITD